MNYAGYVLIHSNINFNDLNHLNMQKNMSAKSVHSRYCNTFKCLLFVFRH